MSTTVKEVPLKTFPFTGNRELSKRWYLATNAYLRVNPKIFDTDEKKVLYALGLMTEGSAQCWAEDFYVAAESASTISSVTGLAVIKADYGKWDDFVIAFMQAFSPVDTKGAAMNKLSTWKMRAGTPASTHIATMNNYISRAEITDFETKKTFLIQSLDNDLVTGLFNSGLANAATYADLTQNILAQENNMNTLKAIQRRNNNRRTQNNYTQNNNNPRYVPHAKDPNAMDVDSTDIRPKRLTDQERDKLKKEGGCFRCRQGGHMASACTKSFKAPVRSAKIEELPDEDTEMNACRVVLDF
jgi:hypothetical protein